jgi:uncharacterized protein YjgD (DUF1641 family)
MKLTAAELMEDIQAEIGESSAEAADLMQYLTDAESCETPVDLFENLTNAKATAEAILSNIKEQLARINAQKR